MIRLYVLDAPEFRAVIDHAAASAMRSRPVGDYVEFTSSDTIVIDRHAARVRRAVWYSAVAALSGGKVAQFDADALRIVPA